MASSTGGLFTVDMPSNFNKVNESNDFLKHGNDCCDDDSHHTAKPSIFDVVKSGLLIPVQTLVEMHGPEILNSYDDKGHTAAHYACLFGHNLILRFIIDSRGAFDEPSHDEVGQRPIHWACINGHISIVDLLLQLGVSVDVTDNKSCTPLIIACQYGQTMLAGYLMGKSAQLLLADREGDTALHWAAFKGHSELVRLLIYSGLNPQQQDRFCQTPLHLACIKGDLISVRELCEIDNVEINLADKNGKTPLMLAKGRKHDKVASYLNKELKRRSSMLPRFDLWSIVVGPPGNTKGALLFMILSLLLYGYPVYIILIIPSTWDEFQPLHLLFIAFNVLMWISLYAASTMDPGFLPRNIAAYDEAIRQVARYDDWRSASTVNPLSRLCHTCRTVKPVRSKHCRVCNRCVSVFDHHCPYIYNCVGYKNRHWFLVFTGCVISMCLIALFLGFYMLKYIEWSWFIMFGLIEVAFFTFVAVVVFVYSVYHAAVNLTTNERINWKRYKYLQDAKGRFYNAFNRGYRRNLLEFFHMRPPLTEKDVEFLNVSVV